MERTVTVFTDISIKFSHDNVKEGVMGYAYFIACDKGKRYGKNIVKKFRGTTYEAEAYAIAFALRDAKKHYGNDIVKGYVYCDNKRVVSMLSQYGKHTDPKSFEGKMQKYINELGYTELDVRYIEGHTKNPNRNKRAYLNDRVDKLSREVRQMVEKAMA